MKKHRTKQGKEIPLSEIKTTQLINIIRIMESGLSNQFNLTLEDYQAEMQRRKQG